MPPPLMHFLLICCYMLCAIRDLYNPTLLLPKDLFLFHFLSRRYGQISLFITSFAYFIKFSVDLKWKSLAAVGVKSHFCRMYVLTCFVMYRSVLKCLNGFCKYYRTVSQTIVAVSNI